MIIRLFLIVAAVASALVSTAAFAGATGQELRVLRTPEERFAKLPGYDFAANYQAVPWGEASLRLHFVDTGPRDGKIVLLLHGQPSWSYMYRNVIHRLAEQGFRVIAPDLIGYGRSDKPSDREDYTYARHIGAVSSFVESLQIQDATLVVHDWGGLIGFPVLARHEDRFSGLVVLNTSLNDGMDRETDRFKAGFDRWIELLRTVPQVDVGAIVDAQTARDLEPEVKAAYMAPYPDGDYQSGVRQMSALIPRVPEDPQARENAAVRERMRTLEIPVLIAFSEDSERLHPGQFEMFRNLFPLDRIRKAIRVPGSRHFLPEDQPDVVAELIAGLVAGDVTSPATEIEDDPVTDELASIMAGFAASGDHRTGSAGSQAWLEFLDGYLSNLGFATERQAIPLLRQEPRTAVLRTSDGSIEDGFPLWPITFTGPDGISGTLRPLGEAGQGDIALAILPYERGASIYLPAYREFVERMSRSPAAGFVLVTEHLSGEVVALNVRVDAAGKSLDGLPAKPILLVGGKDRATIEANLGSEVRLTIEGTQERGEGNNLIASFGPPDAPAIVISTPNNGWFASVAERGPGQAAALVLAKELSTSHPDTALRFVFTSHHELGGAGMKAAQSHPRLRQENVSTWLHLGANLAAREIGFGTGTTTVGTEIIRGRGVAASSSLVALLRRELRGQMEVVDLGSGRAVGEISLVARAGYEPAIGLVGYQPLHHTRFDDGRNVAPGDLAATVRALLRVLSDNRQGMTRHDRIETMGSAR